MKKYLLLAAAGLIIALSTSQAFAGYDDKGSAKGSDYEHKSLTSKSEMQDVMKAYISKKSPDGVFKLMDPKSGVVRNMSYVDLHKKVGLKNDMHYSCADFKDLDTGELIDVDIYVNVDGDDIEVSAAAIHKVDGEAIDGSSKEKGAAKSSGY